MLLSEWIKKIQSHQVPPSLKRAVTYNGKRWATYSQPFLADVEEDDGTLHSYVIKTVCHNDMKRAMSNEQILAAVG
jgi:hypothetical protein